MISLIFVIYRCLREALLVLILPFLTDTVDQENLLKRQSVQEVSTLYFGSVNGTSVVLFLVIVAVGLFLLAALYVPLPKDIADRQKLQFWEFFIRLSVKYLGDTVGRIAGERARNTLIRIFIGLPYAFRRPPKWCTVRDDQIAGVKCRIYSPAQEYLRSKGVVVFMHGGGWCVLRPSHYDGPVYALMRRFGTVVVSIDYRLSPEARFPAAIGDCEAVLKTIYEEKYKSLGIDRDRIAVMGDSAGANLATVVCHRLLRQKRAYVRCQVLINPVTHALDFQSSSYQDYYRSCRDTALLNPSTLAMWYLLYLGIKPTRKNIKSVLENRHFSKDHLEPEIISLIDKAGITSKSDTASRCDKSSEVVANDELSEHFSKLISPDLCPLLGTDLQGLAPAFIATMETDIVRDEGILYAKRLKSFGVPTIWRHYKRGYHGVIHMPRSELRGRMFDDVAVFLKQYI